MTAKALSDEELAEIQKRHERVESIYNGSAEDADMFARTLGRSDTHADRAALLSHIEHLKQSAGWWTYG